jgi:hypothetical protein
VNLSNVRSKLGRWNCIAEFLPINLMF